ncbi:NADPH-dependent curcumin reductase CurA [Rhodococcus sp. 27YEA15]
MDGRVVVPEDFTLDTGPVPEPAPGTVLAKTLAMSVDPVLRGSMTGVKTFYHPQFQLNEPVHSRGVGRVVRSEHPDYRVGDLVTGRFAWADYSVMSPETAFRAGTDLRPAMPSDVKITHHLGLLSSSGETAYYGMVFVSKIRAGDTVVVSGAAGAVGSLAGQIARILGAGKVIGLAGTDEKCEVLTSQLGFDAAINYREPDLASRLEQEIPEGHTIYFDNVGGAVSQAVMNAMPVGGRVVECGQISTYDDAGGGWMVDIRPIHAKRLEFVGFARYHFSEFAPSATAQLAAWSKAGALKALETQWHGLEALPGAFIGMLAGANTGKMVVVLE